MLGTGGIGGVTLGAGQSLSHNRAVPAGQAEVHAAPVPRHVGRLRGHPGPGHGDLLCYGSPAPRQRPELRQEDPGPGWG